MVPLLLLLLLLPGELYRPPQSWAKSVYNIQLWSQMPQVGGCCGWLAGLRVPEGKVSCCCCAVLMRLWQSMAQYTSSCTC